MGFGQTDTDFLGALTLVSERLVAVLLNPLYSGLSGSMGALVLLCALTEAGSVLLRLLLWVKVMVGKEWMVLVLPMLWLRYIST